MAPMIHSHYFIINKAGMPLEEFFIYWRKRHIRAVSEPVPQSIFKAIESPTRMATPPIKAAPNPGTTALTT